MNLENKIEALEKELAELKKVIQKDKIVLTDPCDSNLQVVISINAGEFLIEKVKTVTTIDIDREVIIKDNK